MNHTRRIVPLIFLAIVLLVPVLSPTVLGSYSLAQTTGSPQNNDGSQTVDLGSGNTVRLDEGEELHRFVLTDQGWTEWTGVSSPLTGGEFGNSSNIFAGLAMKYLTTNVTTGTTASIPTGTGWQAYSTSASVTSLSENRTWTQNPDFKTAPSSSDWTLGVTNVAGSSTPTSVYNATGHGTGNGAIDLEVDSTSGSAPYYYDAGDLAWARQTMTIPRGTVVWAGLTLDYWADTRDDTHYGMTGSFSIYVIVEGTTIWETVFDEIDAEETWYNSGMSFVPTSVFNLPTDQAVAIEVGLWSKQSVGYTPDIGPRAKLDNIELYVKTRATPTNVNLKMNGVTVASGTGYGSGTVIQNPATPWTSNPVKLNFTWTPTPVNPVPNRTIAVEFDVNVNMFARRLNTLTVYDINPLAYGERFTIQNGSNANYITYFYADIPSGYPNRYFFNESLPLNRDVYFVGKPLAPSTNLTTGWTGGQVGSGYLNVSTYQVATEAGRYGYWRMQSSSTNMITDLTMYDPGDSNWKRTVNLGAGDSSRIRAFVGASYTGSIANITVFSPEGEKWYSVNATADGSGYATTPFLTFAGSNASAGSWMIQAATNNVGTSGKWTSTGFFRRAFTITHSSELLLEYPTDAVGTWTTNVTYGSLLLIIMKANDTDSSVLVAGGELTLNWAPGSDTFDDSGNGQYTKVVDTSLLNGAGRYAMTLQWTASSYDNANAVLYINVNYAATLESPQYPGVSGPVGSVGIFTVNFRNVNGTGITNGVIACNWSSSYTVTNLGLGSYRITVNTIGIALDEYPVNVTALAPFVNPQTMLMFVEVREVYNTVAYTANQLSIPVGESASFNVTWRDTDNNVPVTGWSSAISCNWTSLHSSGEQNFTVTEPSPGIYEVTVFTESDDPLTVGGKFYRVVFNVARYHYQNHTFTIDVEIRSHNTLFMLDEPIEQTPYNFNIVALVLFEDTDLAVGIDNTSGYVHIAVTSPGLSQLKFAITGSTFGTGHYNITIASNQWGSAGWKNLTISVSWTGGVAKYFGKTINTSVRVLGTDTDLYLEVAPTATYYLNNLTFTLVYWDVVNSTRISNSTGNVILAIVPITGGHPVTQNQFNVKESISTPGTYGFKLNSSLFQKCGTFFFRLDFMWKSGAPPLYENGTMEVTLIVLEQPTYADLSPVQSTAFGEIAVLNFTFVDSLRTSRIQNSSQLTVRLNEGSASYTKTYDSLTRTFSILINTTSLGGVGSFTLHLNLTWTGQPFYAAVTSKDFTVIVILRSTQLTHLSFLPPQYGSSASIEFIYTDLVAGSSAGMTGTLVLNATLAGHYSVTSLGNGHYRVTLDTSAFASDGRFTINATIVYTGSRFASNAAEFFSMTVLRRLTQLGYQSPDPTAYLENVSFTVTYSDDSTGLGISGATVSLSCSNSSESLLLNENYWIIYLGSGKYQILVNASSLGVPASYVLNVTTSRTGTPFYMPASRNVNSIVTQRATQILITQTPSDTPFRENVTFRFRFFDYISGSAIAINKNQITLMHGSSSEIYASNYSLTNYGTYYEISFNSTVLDSVQLVTSRQITLSINASAGVPYYASRTSTTYVTTIQRPTQILFPLVQETAFADNMTLLFDYIDYISGEGIEGADVALASTNLTTPVFYMVELGDGSYEVLVPSQQFGSLGTVYFTLTVNKTGIPHHYADRTAANVPAAIRAILTTLQADVPAAGTRPIGDPFVVNVTLSDFDHSIRVSGATITCDWTARYGKTATIQEIGSGVYRITLNTTGLVAQPYLFTVQAQKTFYQISNISVVAQPGSSAVQISLDSSTYYADWGEEVTIRMTVRETYYFSLVPGMNATLLWNGSVYQFSDLGNGTYVLMLETGNADYGYHEPKVSVSRTYYQTREQTFGLVVSRAAGQILVSRAAGETLPGMSAYDVVLGTSGTFIVYLNDTTNGQPVIADNATIDWNNQVYSLVYNGTPGFYLANVDVTGLAIGQYEAVMRAFETNHVFLDYVHYINVVPVPTTLQLVGGALSVTVIYGNMLDVVVQYNDTYFGGTVGGANVSFVLAGVTGLLQGQPDGTYRALINTSSLAAESIYLRVFASKAGYAATQRTFIANVLPRPTGATINIPTRDGYYGDNVSFLVYFNDTLRNTPISGATASTHWEGGVANVIDLGNGSYLIEVKLSLTTPRLYDFSIALGKSNYEFAQIEAYLVIKPTPAEIQGLTTLSVPVNDTVSVVFNVLNALSSQFVTGLNGASYWTGVGTFPLQTMANGSYSMQIPGTLPIGVYEIDVAFATSVYQIVPLRFSLNVRTVLTELRTPDTTLSTVPGATIIVPFNYIDLDHHVGISGVTPLVTIGTGNATYYPQLTSEPSNNGSYLLYFTVNRGGTFYVTVQFARGQYGTQTILLTILSDISGEEAFLQNVRIVGGSAFILLALLVVVYVKVLSVPKQIRSMNRMIKDLRRGKIPKPPSAPSRAETVLDIVNSNVSDVKVWKVLEDIAPEPILVVIPEVNELLEKLAKITGLGTQEVEAFRTDLARMKPSERPGFLREVIAQEEARRAEALAAAPGVKPPEKVEKEVLGTKPTELEELRAKLQKKGMAPEEVELIVEQAKTLSKADLQALLDSLGIELR